MSKARAASVIFLNPRGELLLRLRDDRPDLPYPAMWDLIGGALEGEESPEEGALRETLEELELRVEGLTAWETHEGYRPQDDRAVDIAIFAAPLDVDAESLVLHEGQRVQFFSPQEAMMLPLVPWLVRVIPPFVRSDVYREICPDARMPVNEEAAAVIFVRPGGELLLRQRGDAPGLMFAGHWDLIGGAMEAGEDPLQAAVRETQEELGMALGGAEYWGSMRGVVLLHVFGAPLDVASESLVLTEGAGVAWHSPQAAMGLELVPYMRQLIPRFADSDLYKRLAAG